MAKAPKSLTATMALDSILCEGKTAELYSPCISPQSKRDRLPWFRGEDVYTELGLQLSQSIHEASLWEPCGYSTTAFPFSWRWLYFSFSTGGWLEGKQGSIKKNEVSVENNIQKKWEYAKGQCLALEKMCYSFAYAQNSSEILKSIYNKHLSMGVLDWKLNRISE